MKEEALEYLKNNWAVLRQIVSECSCYDGSLQEYEYYENDEWFFKDFFSDAWKAVQMVCNGDYNSLDEYVQFDYDCLNSYSEIEVKENLIENAEEIFDRWYEMYQDNEVQYDYYDDEFKEIIDKIGGEENDED